MGAGLLAAIGLGSMALGSVGSALITSSSNKSIANSNLEAQKSANATNLQAVQATNAANMDLWREQSSEMWKMFDATNKYNSPVNQVQRLSAAGINPLLAMSGNNTGNATSINLPNAPNLQAPQVQPVKQDYVPPAMAGVLEALSSLPSQYAALKSSFADTQIKEAQAITASGTSNLKIQQEIARLEGMVENNKLTKSQRLKAYADLKYYDTWLQTRTLQQEMDYNLTTAQYEHTVASTIKTYAEADSAAMLAKFQKEGLPMQLKQMEAALSETYARVASTVASKNLTEAQTKKVIQDTFTVVLQNEGIKMDNTQKKALLPNVIRTTQENLNKVFHEAGTFNRGFESSGLFRALQGMKGYAQGFIPMPQFKFK